MNELLHSLTFFSANAAGALFAAIWEGAILCACVALCLRLLHGLSAAARSVVWLNVFVLLLLLHMVPAFTGRPTALVNGHLPALHLDWRWSLGLTALWAAISLGRAMQLILGAVHVRGLARRAIPVRVDTEVEALLADAPRGRAAQLCTSEEVARPSVLGFLRPRILIPTALLQRLSSTELQQVVLHEMEHLRRADDWTNLLQKVGLVLFPLNPVLLWVERRLCAERELACDDRVVRSSAGRKAYALCLTRLAEYSILRRSFSLVLGLWSRRPELVRRVHRILRQPVRSMGRRTAMIATGGVLAGALGCAVALSHSPQLVSFVPVHQGEEQAASYVPLDAHELGRALGGTPQLAKATMPAAPLQSAGMSSWSPTLSPERLRKAGARRLVTESIQPAVVKRAERRRPAASKMARLTPAPAPLAVFDERILMVLTEWTYQVQPRVVLAVSTDRHVPPAVAIPATYAIVPTPHGWLIIQI